jgi:SAM-dependent methyltransferase
MRPDTPDFRHRADLVELMDQPCSRETLRACLRDIARTNRWTFGARPVLWWLDAVTRSLPELHEPLRILDVGSGYGDGLRRVEQWASARGISVELFGLDLNPDAAAIAAEAGAPTSRIQWITSDVLQYRPTSQPHLIFSSLIAHHLSNAQVVEFLKWMECHAQFGWFINDLARGAVPYHVFRLFSKLVRLHPFVQYDGPVSVARAFIPEDWKQLCAAAGLREPDIQLRRFKPARLCVERRKFL